MAYDENNVWHLDWDDYLEVGYRIVILAILLYFAVYGLTFRATIDGKKYDVHYQLSSEY